MPIYLQLIDEIKIDILAGRWQPGDKLPAVRVFAFTKKVNPNTLQRALAELEREGLICTERTNGKFVTQDKQIIEQARRAYADKITAEYRERMLEIGFLPKPYWGERKKNRKNSEK